MKRSNLSIESRKKTLKKKTSVILNRNPMLPLIKDATSPLNSLNGLSNTEDLKPSSKLKRALKSQIPFNFTNRPEEIKLKTTELLLKQRAGSDERELSEDEQKSKFDEVGNEAIRKLKDEIKALKSTINEKCIYISRLESKYSIMKSTTKKKMNLLELNSSDCGATKINNFDLHSQHGSLSERSNAQLKEIIQQQIENYKTLEEMYNNDTNQLKYEIELSKAQCKRLDTDFESIKLKYESVSKLLDENAKKYMEQIQMQQKNYIDLKQQYGTKNIEVSGLNEFIRKIQAEKQAKLEMIKNLQQQLIEVSESNKFLENEQSALRRIIKTKDDELLTEKNIAKNVENYINEIKALKDQNHKLTESTKELQKDIEFVTSNYKEIQQSYARFREQAQEKENTFQAVISKMNDSSNALNSNTIKAQERTRIRRTSTLVNNFNEGAPIDGSTRLMTKIAGLEEELASYREEQEKLSKNLNYSKKIIDEKNHMIEKLEHDLKTELQNMRTKLNSDIYTFVEDIDTNTCELVDLLKCELCGNRTGQTFMFWPCDHILCENCLNFEEFCMKCGASSRIIKFELIKTLVSKLQRQLKGVEELKKTLNGISY